MAACIVSGIVYETDGVTPKGRVALTVRRVLLDGQLISTVNKTYSSDPSTGVISLLLPRGAVAYISADIEGFDRKQNGTPVIIPDTPTANLKDLLPALNPPSTAVSQSTFNAAVSDLQGQINELSAPPVVIEVSADAVLDLGVARKALILMDTSAGDVTVTLQPLTEMTGREIIILKIADDNLAIVDGDGAELINGSLVFNLEMNNQFVGITPGGSQWRVVRKG